MPLWFGTIAVVLLWLSLYQCMLLLEKSPEWQVFKQGEKKPLVVVSPSIFSFQNVSSMKTGNFITSDNISAPMNIKAGIAFLCIFFPKEE